LAMVTAAGLHVGALYLPAVRLFRQGALAQLGQQVADGLVLARRVELPVGAQTGAVSWAAGDRWVGSGARRWGASTGCRSGFIGMERSCGKWPMGWPRRLLAFFSSCLAGR
jgi:hypothetical protein